MSDIVERLRADGDQMRATGLVPEGKQPLAHEAADAITTLRAENAAATDLVNEYSMAIIRMQGERDTLRAENERMRRWVERIATQPMAEQACKDHEDEGHDGEPDFEGAYDAIIEQARELKKRVKP